jgi:putative aldouronate transport system substrate-binding protein
MLTWTGLAGAAAVLGACAPKIVEVEKEVTKVVKEVVKETVVVAGTPVVQEKVVEKVVTVQPAPGQPMLITFCDSQAFGAPHYHSTQDPIAKAVSDKMQDEGLNIRLQILIMDDPRTEYPLLYAAGSHFTFSFDAPWYHMTSFLQQGYLLPLEDLFAEHGPNIIKAVGQQMIDMNYMFGHLYGLPTGGIYRSGTGIVIREDLRKKHGLPEPGPRYEDLEPFLEAIQKAEPNLIPFAVDKTQHMGTEGLHPYTGPERPWSPLSQTQLSFADALAGEPELVEVETIERFVNARKLARSWYQKGWLNKNALQLQQPAVQELFTPGKAAAIRFQEPAQKRYDVQIALRSFVPEGEARGWDTTGVVSGESKWLASLRVWNFIVFNSQIPMEESVAGVQFFNWLLGDQDNIDLWLYGIDGVNYQKLPDMRYDDIPGTDGATNYRRKWFSGGVPFTFVRHPSYADDAYMAEVKALTSLDNFIINPLEGFQFNSKPVETELAQVNAAAEATINQVNCGMVDVEEGLAAFTKAVDEAGRPKVKEELLKQFAEWRAANK